MTIVVEPRSRLEAVTEPEVPSLPPHLTPQQPPKTMPPGSKAKYSSKQKRQAHDIEKSYEKRGTAVKTAQARAWATVNQRSGGAKGKRSK